MTKIILIAVMLCQSAAAQPPTPVDAKQKGAGKKSQPHLRHVESGSGVVAVDPKQPYRPLPANRTQQRETIFEFYLRTLNPRQIDWGQEIDRRMAVLAEQSALNPYFRFSALQMALILVLILTSWLWWDKMRQIKQVAAESLADAINAKRIADQKALDAVAQYNRHIEMCNRVIEHEESGIPTGAGTEELRRDLREMQTQLTAEKARTVKLETDLKNREDIQRTLESRIRQLEQTMSERQGGANAELVARLQRAEAELNSHKKQRS
ncbi:MAG: hypothetical protein J0H49_13795 [Acidobacteria bacterium]|nr:hypothetical protein [Acidobacteriota bacterium]